MSLNILLLLCMVGALGWSGRLLLNGVIRRRSAELVDTLIGMDGDASLSPTAHEGRLAMWLSRAGFRQPDTPNGFGGPAPAFEDRIEKTMFPPRCPGCRSLPLPIHLPARPILNPTWRPAHAPLLNLIGFVRGIEKRQLTRLP